MNIWLAQGQTSVLEVAVLTITRMGTRKHTFRDEQALSIYCG